jgi:NAD(P)-dependent dehydrogenase (short-subunit alcohol dehydrogenase family)
MEGRPHGIRVTVVFPPDTETPMLAYERAPAPAETLAITAGARQLSADVVARRFVEGMVRGKFEVYCNGEKPCDPGWSRRCCRRCITGCSIGWRIGNLEVSIFVRADTPWS